MIDKLIKNVYFSGNQDITLDFLVEIDKLIQLIESPVFACTYFILTTAEYYLKLTFYFSFKTHAYIE